MKPFEIKKTLNKYLDRHYDVCDNFFAHINTTDLISGQEIVLECHVVFDFDILECEKVFRKWSFSKGLSENSFNFAYKKQIYWSTEFTNDIHMYHNIDAEAELIAYLTQEISNEIDREIINDLININGNQNVTSNR